MPAVGRWDLIRRLKINHKRKEEQGICDNCSKSSLFQIGMSANYYCNDVIKDDKTGAERE